jgi:hypothetical protein
VIAVQFVRVGTYKTAIALFKEASMSTTAITMEELESEHAELLPSRETLTCRCGYKSPYASHSSSTSVTQIGQGNAIGTNYNQVGLLNVQADNNNVNILGLQNVL